MPIETGPIIGVIVVGGVFAVILFKLLSKNKLKLKWKPSQLRDTVYEEFKKKLSTIGIKLKKGELYIAFNKVASIDRYLVVEAKLTSIFVNAKTMDEFENEEDLKNVTSDEKEKLLIVRARSKSILLRLLGLRKYYFILHMADGIKLDPTNGRIFLPVGTDFQSYGNIWINHDASIEYINDISIKRQMEQQRSELENMPQRVVLLNVDQAMKERTIQAMAATERLRYDEIKKAQDTGVT